MTPTHWLTFCCGFSNEQWNDGVPSTHTFKYPLVGAGSLFLSVEVQNVALRAAPADRTSTLLWLLNFWLPCSFNFIPPTPTS